MSQIGTTQTIISQNMTIRPPNLSVHIPSGTRISEPVSTGVAVSSRMYFFCNALTSCQVADERFFR